MNTTINEELLKRAMLEINWEYVFARNLNQGAANIHGKIFEEEALPLSYIHTHGKIISCTTKRFYEYVESQMRYYYTFEDSFLQEQPNCFKMGITCLETDYTSLKDIVLKLYPVKKEVYA